MGSQTYVKSSDDCKKENLSGDDGLLEKIVVQRSFDRWQSAYRESTYLPLLLGEYEAYDPQNGLCSAELLTFRRAGL